MRATYDEGALRIAREQRESLFPIFQDPRDPDSWDDFVPKTDGERIERMAHEIKILTKYLEGWKARAEKAEAYRIGRRDDGNSV